MINALKLRAAQGEPVIPDVHAAVMPPLYRGLPVLRPELCESGCSACAEACPTEAITLDPLTLDLGKCIFCPVCVEACRSGAITYSGAYHLATSSRDGLKVTAETAALSPGLASEKIRSLFGRSLKLRSVSAAGCNGCELELNALSNVNFDMGRYGIEFVASPRHADGIVISGPVSSHMAAALRTTYEAVPHPKIVIAFGACAISGGVFAGSPELDRSFFGDVAVDLFIPGCPPHPLTFIAGLLDYLGRK